jgi:membrane-associated phospholipid phosphatase
MEVISSSFPHRELINPYSNSAICDLYIFPANSSWTSKLPKKIAASLHQAQAFHCHPNLSLVRSIPIYAKISKKNWGEFLILFIKKYCHLLFILSIAGQGLIYTLIAAHFSQNSVSIGSWIDDRIPYVSWFVIFYAAWMIVLYAAFIYMGLTDRSLYLRTIIVYNVAVTVSNIIFILFPTHMPRPEISGNDIFTRLVQFIYSNDKPVNCFPSIHCLTSYLLLVSMNRHKLFSVSLRIVFSVLLWSIIASTVFIKQHAFIDVIGGVALAELTYRIVYYILSKQKKVMLIKQDGTGVSLLDQA